MGNGNLGIMLIAAERSHEGSIPGVAAVGPSDIPDA